MNYNKWEELFLNANSKAHEATLKVWKLEDECKENTEQYYAWNKEAKEWSNIRDYYMAEYPKYHTQYVNNRGKPSQTKSSTIANGGQSKGKVNNTSWYEEDYLNLLNKIIFYSLIPMIVLSIHFNYYDTDFNIMLYFLIGLILFFIANISYCLNTLHLQFKTFLILFVIYPYWISFYNAISDASGITNIAYFGIGFGLIFSLIYIKLSVSDC